MKNGDKIIFEEFTIIWGISNKMVTLTLFEERFTSIWEISNDNKCGDSDTHTF